LLSVEILGIGKVLLMDKNISIFLFCMGKWITKNPRKYIFYKIYKNNFYKNNFL